MKRRTFLSSLSLATAATLTQSADAKAQTSATPDTPDSKSFRFHADGTFKILSVSDFHYVPTPDTYGIALTETLIKTEKPDLVIVNGDTISGGRCANADEVKKATDNVATAMENLKVPWVVTLGNHDIEEGEVRNHFTRTQLISHYEQYPNNRNAGWNRDLYGAGNKNLLIWSADGFKPLFNVWLLDSGANSAVAECPGYDWIHADQVDWYRETSRKLEGRYGGKIPSLMFFHIPIPEFRELIQAGAIIGERHEGECPSGFNGGMFAAAAERGEVKGMFCGHDHVNNYMGKYHGIFLGYDGMAGFIRAYPHLDPDDPANGRVRGGRLFLLNASAPEHFKTWMRFHDGSANWEASSDAYLHDRKAFTD